MSRKIDSPGQVADIIERFLSGSGRYPQEFNDFFECSLSDPKLDAYRQRCELLHSEFEPRPGYFTLLSLENRQQQARREAAAVKELQQLVAELRLLAHKAKRPEKSTH
jgi:hypothetical protein